MKEEDMFNTIRVVHVAVNSVEEAAQVYKEKFGIDSEPPHEQPATGIRATLIQMGETSIELIQPLDPEEGPVAKFLKNRGEGIYMMGVEVDDIDETVKKLEAKGVRLINAEPRVDGVPVFIHPKENHGVMLELVEKPK